MTQVRTLFDDILHWLGFDATTVSHTEKLIATAGAFVGIFITAWISLHIVGLPAAFMIVGSIGASAVLLFAVPHGQLSQPWGVLGGHLISALVGVSCAKYAPGGPTLVIALTVSLAIGAMHAAHCIHPPGGATALIAVMGSADIQALGYGYVIMPIGVNVLLLLTIAFIFNYPFAWRRYPAALHARHYPRRDDPTGIQPEDIEHALQTLDTPIDVPDDELRLIYKLAEQHAVKRRLKNRGYPQG